MDRRSSLTNVAAHLIYGEDGYEGVACGFNHGAGHINRPDIRAVSYISATRRISLWCWNAPRRDREFCSCDGMFQVLRAVQIAAIGLHEPLRALQLWGVQ